MLLQNNVISSYVDNTCIFECYRLRAQFGSSIVANAVHGASNRISADNEINLIFGDVDFDKEGLTSGFLYALLPFAVQIVQTVY